MLDLKELAELQDKAKPEKAKEKLKEKLPEQRLQEQIKVENNNRKIRALRLNALYNPRYFEEKERYVRNLEVKKAYYNLVN